MLAVLDAANQRMNSVLQIPSWVPTGRNLRERHALAQLDGMLHTFIQTRRASSERRDDLLSVLLAAVDEDSGHSVSNQQLRDEMMTLSGRTRDNRERTDMDVVSVVTASGDRDEIAGGARSRAARPAT